MKLMEKLVAPPDDKALFRQIAQMALDGDALTVKQAAAVELYETTDDSVAPPTKDEVAKLVATLRSRLASVDMGRFSVTHNGGALAYVTVNGKPVRKRTVTKKATPPVTKKVAAPKS